MVADTFDGRAISRTSRPSSRGARDTLAFDGVVRGLPSRFPEGRAESSPSHHLDQQTSPARTPGNPTTCEQHPANQVEGLESVRVGPNDLPQSSLSHSPTVRTDRPAPHLPNISVAPAKILSHARRHAAHPLQEKHERPVSRSPLPQGDKHGGVPPPRECFSSRAERIDLRAVYYYHLMRS